MMAPPWRHKPKNQTTRAHGRGHERERLGGPKRPSRMTPAWREVPPRDGDNGEQAENAAVVRRR